MKQKHYPNEKLELRGLRAKHRMSLKDMAGILGITTETYSRKEKGLYDFTEAEINRVLTYFGVRYEDIFLPKDPQNEDKKHTNTGGNAN